MATESFSLWLNSIQLSTKLRFFSPTGATTNHSTVGKAPYGSLSQERNATRAGSEVSPTCRSFRHDEFNTSFGKT